jgi:hypothetical protein
VYPLASTEKYCCSEKKQLQGNAISYNVIDYSKPRNTQRHLRSHLTDEINAVCVALNTVHMSRIEELRKIMQQYAPPSSTGDTGATELA